jgi:hypothetical protein
LTKNFIIIILFLLIIKLTRDNNVDYFYKIQSSQTTPTAGEAQTGFDTLPDELICPIFGFLSRTFTEAGSYMPLLLVNRRWNCIALTPSIIKLAVSSLGWAPKDCMRSLPPPHVTFARNDRDDWLSEVRGFRSKFQSDPVKLLACDILVDMERGFWDDIKADLLELFALADFPGYESAEFNYNLALLYRGAKKKKFQLIAEPIKHSDSITKSDEKAKQYLKQTIQRLCQKAGATRESIPDDPLYGPARDSLLHLGVSDAEIEKLIDTELTSSKESLLAENKDALLKLPASEVIELISRVSLLEKYGFHYLCKGDKKSAQLFFEKASRCASFQGACFMLYQNKIREREMIKNACGGYGWVRNRELRPLLLFTALAELPLKSWKLASFQLFLATYLLESEIPLACCLGHFKGREHLEAFDFFNQKILNRWEFKKSWHSPDHGVKLLKLAADNGFNPALFLLALYYLKGGNFGKYSINKNIDAAIFYFEAFLKKAEKEVLTEINVKKLLTPNQPSEQRDISSVEGFRQELAHLDEHNQKGVGELLCRAHQYLGDLNYKKNELVKAWEHYVFVRMNYLDPRAPKSLYNM